MPPPKQPDNPYAKAAGAYGDHAQKHTPDQRELEGRVLLKAAKMMKDLQDQWDDVDVDTLEQALKYNRQLWMMFYDTALENPEEEGEKRPDGLRENILNLSNFVFKREIDILADKERNPKKLDILININREIAGGLMGSAGKAALPEESSAPPPQEQQEQGGSSQKNAEAEADDHNNNTGTGSSEDHTV
jgi:flagellar protein FlaF